jgi:hypothetical protein
MRPTAKSNLKGDSLRMGMSFGVTYWNTSTQEIVGGPYESSSVEHRWPCRWLRCLMCPNWRPVVKVIKPFLLHH